MGGAEAVLEQLVNIGGPVWRASWQASVLAALVLSLQLIFGRRISARWRHAMWMLVLVRLALPVVPSSPLSVFNLALTKAPVMQTAHAPAFEVEGVAGTTSSDIDSHADVSYVVGDQLNAKPQAAERMSLRDLWTGWPQVLATLWAAGALALALRIGCATWRVSRMLRRLDRIDDVAVHEVLGSTAAEIGVRRLPLLLAGDGLFSPALVGCIRPKLLVPRDLLVTFDPAELRLIFLHELAHLKRRDVAINWAATVLSVLHWLNPIAWLVVWRLRIERELACDELVMSRTSDTDRRAYGHTIVKLLETFSRADDGGGNSIAIRRPLPAGGVGILEGKAQMKRRITMIAQFARSSRTWTIVGACLVLTLALVALTDAVKAQDATAAPAAGTVPGKPATTVPSATAELAASPSSEELAKSDPAMAQYVARLRELEFNRAQQQQQLNNHHPKVLALEAEIAQTKEFIDAMAAAHRERLNKPTKLKNGDLVTVSIMELFGAGVETVKTARIDGDGTINLPYVGAVKATGLSPAELEKAIAKQYLDKGVIQNAVVAVSMPERGESHQMARVRGSVPEPAVIAEAPAVPSPIAPAAHADPAMMEDPAMMGIAALPLAPAAEWDEATKTTMTRKIPEMKVDSVAFSDVVDALRDLTSANIFVNWPALEAAGIDRSVPVTMTLRDVALKDVLSLMLRHVGGGVMYKVENGVIVIDVPTRPAKAPKVTTKTYDVMNLLTGEITEQNIKAQVNELQRVIVSTVQPSTWQRGGGIAAFESRLVVTASDDVHKDVGQLLKMLQRDASKPTTNPVDPTKRTGSETGF